MIIQISRFLLSWYSLLCTVVICICSSLCQVQLPEKIVIYELFGSDATDMQYRVRDRIPQRIDCTLLVVCTSHVVLCQVCTLHAALVGHIVTAMVYVLTAPLRPLMVFSLLACAVVTTVQWAHDIY